MKKIGLLIFILLTNLLVAQHDGDHKELMEKIESKRIAFISDKLELTPEEAQQFWPVYNAYNKEMKALRPPEPMHEMEMTADVDADAMLDQMIKNEEIHLALKKKYTSQIKQIIGSKKTLMLYQMERKFKEEMLKGLKKKRMGDKGKGK